MSNGTAADADRAAPGAQDGRTDLVDWARIERSPEFRELTSRRHRFILGASALTFGSFAVYLGLATFATDFMGTTVGGVPIAWLAAMTQVLMTWAVTWTYLRKADREFAPLEQRVRDTAGARFTREDGDAAAASPAPAESTATERSAR
jgi:uncharacterized membrane protein (DUF485 family)